MEKKLIIFDVDGTLIDSEKDVFICLNHILKININIDITYEEFKSQAGKTLEQSIEFLLPEDKKHLVTELASKYRKYYIDEGHMMDTTTLYNGVAETLDYLKKQGFILVILSSKAEIALKPILENLNITQQFDLVVGTGLSNFKHKPDPEAINYILEKYNISKEDAVMIGDTKADIFAGQNAGVETIALTYGYETEENIIKCKPNFMIGDFSQIRELIRFKE